jgi:hypothetical protein
MITLNPGVYNLGGYKLTVVDPPGPSTVGTPEPASLLLLLRRTGARGAPPSQS